MGKITMVWLCLWWEVLIRFRVHVWGCSLCCHQANTPLSVFQFVLLRVWLYSLLFANAVSLKIYCHCNVVIGRWKLKKMINHKLLNPVRWQANNYSWTIQQLQMCTTYWSLACLFCFTSKKLSEQREHKAQITHHHTVAICKNLKGWM